jgi:hypothetical protein
MADINLGPSPFPASPVTPEQLDEDHVIQFRCHKDVACFNACCKSIDIALTPYDILRLKNHLGISSSEFLLKYTEPFEFSKDGMPGVKLLPEEGTTQCQFMVDEGCSVYGDRPTACRYYPVGLLSLRRADENTDTASYVMVREKHCLGHEESREITIHDYRKEQGVEEYDEQSRGWRQMVLKMKSAGPSIGTPSKLSRQLFFMASYDLDRFREFTKSAGFLEAYGLTDAELQKLYSDDLALLQFGYRFLLQVLFGEQTIPMTDGAYENRLKRKQQLKESEQLPSPFVEQEAAFDAPVFD